MRFFALTYTTVVSETWGSGFLEICNLELKKVVFSLKVSVWARKFYQILQNCRNTFPFSQKIEKRKKNWFFMIFHQFWAFFRHIGPSKLVSWNMRIFRIFEVLLAICASRWMVVTRLFLSKMLWTYSPRLKLSGNIYFYEDMMRSGRCNVPFSRPIFGFQVAKWTPDWIWL